MSIPVPAVTLTFTDLGEVSSTVGMYPVSHIARVGLAAGCPTLAIFWRGWDQKSRPLLDHFAEDHVVLKTNFVSLLPQHCRDLRPMADAVNHAVQ